MMRVKKAQHTHNVRHTYAENSMRTTTSASARAHTQLANERAYKRWEESEKTTTKKKIFNGCSRPYFTWMLYHHNTFTHKSFTFSPLIFGFDFYSVSFFFFFCFTLHFVCVLHQFDRLFFLLQLIVSSLPLPFKWWLYVFQQIFFFLFLISLAGPLFNHDDVVMVQKKNVYFLTLATKAKREREILMSLFETINVFGVCFVW